MCLMWPQWCCWRSNKPAKYYSDTKILYSCWQTVTQYMPPEHLQYSQIVKFSLLPPNKRNTHNHVIFQKKKYFFTIGLTKVDHSMCLYAKLYSCWAFLEHRDRTMVSIYSLENARGIRSHKNEEISEEAEMLSFLSQRCRCFPVFVFTEAFC